ncbi:transcriptional regulator, AraC family [Azospirillum lipoferum]|nr:transcriptional regulator, AraC family [Azospirillum lipoferum]
MPVRNGFVAVELRNPAAALHVAVTDNRSEIPVHEHESGQLILALCGAVTCHVPGSIWMVPPGRAVWIPAGVPHHSLATANSRMCFLFVQPNAACLPTQCSTLEITPLVREMILHLADQPYDDSNADEHALRFIQVLLRELEKMSTGGLQLPVSSHPKLKQLQDALTADPSDRTTLAEWGRRIAISERTLARLIVRETGMTFGRWRQQLHLLVALAQLSGGSSVQQVSDALGYESATSFIIMFKKALGTTPARYFDNRTT